MAVDAGWNFRFVCLSQIVEYGTEREIKTALLDVLVLVVWANIMGICFLEDYMF